MKNKKKIRERPIDYKKPFSIIKDLKKEKLNANDEKLIELNNIENDLYKVLDYYDKRKKIEIPKTKIINEKNDKNENFKNYLINNNIIYKNENHLNSNQNNNEYKLNYKLNEYKRPNNYIIYSTSERNRINFIKKDYEVKEADLIYLKIKENFMKPEELENIVIELENNVTYNKEDKIDEEKARKIIETKYPKYTHYADSIITHFKDRRKTIKNSLLRKKWKKNTTFQKRRNDKIKIRKNIQNLKEPLNKIVESQTFCKNNVLPIINCLFMKEKLNKNLIKINELIFLTESNKIKNIKTPENRLKDYNILKENIQKIVKNFTDKDFYDKKNDINDNYSDEYKVINKVSNINSNVNINSNINSNININSKINEIKKDIKSNNINTTSNVEEKINESVSSLNNSKIIERKNTHVSNKNNLKNKIETIFPPLSLDILKNTNSNNKINKYRVRIRINRTNNITVDRYIQLKEDEDFNPFHDSFNKIINDYKKYNDNEFAVNTLEKKNFENLFNYYSLNKVKNLQLDESDDDSTYFNNDIKQFSSSYKQFLKLKRSHT